MPDRMSDADVLAQTAEWLSRLADTIERVTEGLADSLARVQARQNEQADEIRALSNRIESHARANAADVRHLRDAVDALTTQ